MANVDVQLDFIELADIKDGQISPGESFQVAVSFVPDTENTVVIGGGIDLEFDPNILTAERIIYDDDFNDSSKNSGQEPIDTSSSGELNEIGAYHNDSPLPGQLPTDVVPAPEGNLLFSVEFTAKDNLNVDRLSLTTNPAEDEQGIIFTQGVIEGQQDDGPTLSQEQASIAESVTYGTLDITTSGEPPSSLTLTGGTAQIAYVAYYGRPADGSGLEFWNGVLTDNEVSYAPREGDRLTGQEQGFYNQIVNDFGNSEEANRLFGEFNSNREKVNQVYQFAFNRNGDAEGLDYWTDQINQGNVTLATFALEVALGAQNEDIVVLNNKIESADLFTNSIDTPGEIEAYQGSEAEFFGRNWLDNYSLTASTQTEVDSALQDLVVL
ncbi:MAG: DUF4214 domain-containing protein [Xenococcaceae cyanobacterium]